MKPEATHSSRGSRPPLSDSGTYSCDDLRRQLDWFEAAYGMTSQDHCDRRDDWLTDRGPHPLPGHGFDSSVWDDYFHEWEELA